MPHIRPLRAIPRLGGSPAVGGSWSDDRLADSDAELPRLPALQVKPLVDGSGWHASVLAGKPRDRRLAYCPGADPAGPWRWAIRYGADGRVFP